MELALTIKHKHDTFFLEQEEVSIKQINGLARTINLLCMRQGDFTFTFCKSLYPNLFYNRFEFTTWNIVKPELVVSRLKRKMFHENGELRKIKLNSDIYFNQEVIKMISNSNKIYFLGFLRIYAHYREGYSQKSAYVSPVYSLVSDKSQGTLFASKSLDGKQIIEVLEYKNFTPQDVVCQNCEYFSGKYLGEEYLTCTINPSGPNLGYDGCTDKLLFDRE
ncbi:hypothetical protein FD723_40705 (plasmid) [Nostoc sp. C052]|uniref:hypothetical protein n=1 Tax=Nostoc sp. C052 TaxID=2576902 RepID=UPI0015C36580|nr:hypothetical protein [Nostoc sp. C052]QLE46536.1 hypothetical protein FD723_40705 [Nostoc sp. C052]